MRLRTTGLDQSKAPSWRNQMTPSRSTIELSGDGVDVAISAERPERGHPCAQPIDATPWPRALNSEKAANDGTRNRWGTACGPLEAMVRGAIAL
jgi:hypothetical protein